MRVGDSPAWPDLQTKKLTQGGQHWRLVTDWKLVGIDEGMASGATSITLRFDMPDGSVVLAETSLATWIAATCALRGAYPLEFDGTPLEEPR